MSGKITTTKASFELINLTPHVINFVVEETEGDEIKSQFGLLIPSSGQAKVIVNSVPSKHDIGIPIHVTTFGQVTGLPEEKPNTYYIVSTMVRTALPNRKDLLSPSTNPKLQIRDEKGQMTGCKAFDANY